MSCRELIESLRRGSDDKVRGLWQEAEAGRIRSGIKNRINALRENSARVSRIIEGGFSLDEQLGEYADGREIPGCHEWPVRLARPYRRKFAPSGPLVTGQRRN